MKKIIACICLAVLFIMSSTVLAAVPADWQDVSGYYTRDDNTQYDMGVMQLRCEDDGSMFFQLKAMAGTEGANDTIAFKLAGSLVVDENGVGTCKYAAEDGAVQLWLTLDGDSIRIQQDRELPVRIAGTYQFIHPISRVAEDMTSKLLRDLPVETTGLTGCPFVLQCTTGSAAVDDSFYHVQAVNTVTGQAFAAFEVAKGFKTAYRLDADGGEVLIYDKENR